MNRLSGWNCRAWVCGLAVVLTYGTAGFGKENVITPDLSRINDAKTWSLINADFDATTKDGKSAIQLMPKGKVDKGSNVGLALVQGLEFGEGTLEVDLKGKGKLLGSFVGLAFNVVDGKTFEAVYFRPFNFMRDPESFRARAVQYVAWPDNPWEKLRKATPGKYESTVNPVPDPADWFHARVEVTQKKVRVWVDDAKEPCLVVDRLASRTKGKVGLWVDSHEGWFGNLKIVPAK
jgi:hypothetical protein